MPNKLVKNECLALVKDERFFELGTKTLNMS